MRPTEEVLEQIAADTREILYRQKETEIKIRAILEHYEYVRELMDKAMKVLGTIVSTSAQVEALRKIEGGINEFIGTKPNGNTDGNN